MKMPFWSLRKTTPATKAFTSALIVAALSIAWTSHSTAAAKLFGGVSHSELLPPVASLRGSVNQSDSSAERNNCQPTLPAAGKEQRLVEAIPQTQLLPISHLLTMALDNRPELKQFEELRLAARQQINNARADLLPSASLGGNILGIASNLGAMNPTYFLNFGVNWQFQGLGATAATNVAQSRWQARQAMLQANKMFLNVSEQVRNSYNETITAERAIDEATDEVVSAKEELRLARLRLDNGLGTNLEVLTAQRDLTQARVDQALALVTYNKSQTQLLHDIGLISVDNITSGRVLQAPAKR